MNILYCIIFLVSSPIHSKWMVVIDPGHYQINSDRKIINPGASGVTEDGKRITELEENLKIAQQLERIFKKKASDRVDVRLTHNGPTYFGNRERSILANDSHADIFVRIHMNSSSSTKTRGTETYYYWENSKRVAEIIHAHLVEFTKRDRGVHQHFERGLKYSRHPSVTVELGYLSNPTEASKLANPTYQEGLANALYNGIMDFLMYACGDTETFSQELIEPRGIDIDKEGNFWIADWGGVKVVKLSPIGESLQTIELDAKPSDIACVDDKIYVATSDNCIEIHDSNGRLIKKIGEVGLSKGKFRDINKISSHRWNLFIAEEGNHRIQVYNTITDMPLRTFGRWTRYGGLFEDLGSVVCHNKRLYVTDFERNILFVFTPNGKIIKQIPYSSDKYHLDGISSCPGKGIFIVAGSEKGNITLIKLVGEDKLVTMRDFKAIYPKPNFPDIVVSKDKIWITDASSGRIITIKTTPKEVEMEEELPLYTLIPNLIENSVQVSSQGNPKSSKRVFFNRFPVMPILCADLVKFKNTRNVKLECGIGLRFLFYKDFSLFLVKPITSYIRGGIVWQIPLTLSYSRRLHLGLDLGGSCITINSVSIGFNIGFDILNH